MKPWQERARMLAWLNGSGGGGKNFPFHPSQAYHSWLLGRLIELRMHSQGFLQNVLWFHGKMLKQHQYRIVLLRKHFANFWHHNIIWRTQFKDINMKIDIWYVKKWLIQLLWVYFNIFACMHGKAYKGGIMLENILILYSSIAQI